MEVSYINPKSSDAIVEGSMCRWRVFFVWGRCFSRSFLRSLFAPPSTIFFQQQTHCEISSTRPYCKHQSFFTVNISMTIKSLAEKKKKNEKKGTVLHRWNDAATTTTTTTTSSSRRRSDETAQREAAATVAAATPPVFPVAPTVIQTIPRIKGTMNHSYRDFSQVPPPVGYRPPGDIADMTFAQKVHAMLSLEHHDYGHVVSWMPHGRAFKVHKPQTFEKELCPLYFGHARYSSFLRALNNYGFKHLSRGVDRNCKCHIPVEPCTVLLLTFLLGRAHRLLS